MFKPNYIFYLLSVLNSNYVVFKSMSRLNITRISPKMFDCRQFNGARVFTIASILIAAIFCVSSVNNILYFRGKEVYEEVKIVQIKSRTSHIPLRSIQEVEEFDGQNQNSLIPPLNVTEEERILWLKGKLPEFEIFKSDRLTEEFHGRVLEFFSNDCEAQFFMTWIAKARDFGRKDFLAMESLFKVHPNGCLIIVSRTMDSKYGYGILKPILDKGFKVTAITPDLSFLLKDTPAEFWYEEMKGGNKDPGEIPLHQNLSNLIRLAVLYKYGGTYIDTDFIVLKNFSVLRNSIGAQSVDMVSKNWTRLNNAVLVFDMNHPLLFKFIQEFALTFDGNKWGHNGPYLITRVVARVQGRPGYNFTILPPSAFYPVIWTKITTLFKKPDNQAESRWVEAKLLQISDEAYGVHLWNKQSRRLNIEEGSIVGRLMSNHCVICEDIYSS